MFACSLAALALLACARAHTDFKYESVDYKGNEDNHLTDWEPFYIPDGHCSGVLAQDLFPADCKRPRALRVTSRDHAQFPDVQVAATLRSIDVSRQPSAGGGCVGRAPVLVQADCGW